MDQKHDPRAPTDRRLPSIARRAWPFAACLLALWSLAPARAEIRNDAVAAGAHGAQTVLSAPSGQSVPLAAAAPSLAASVAPGSKGFAIPGDVATFEITVTNAGNVTLHDLVIGDSAAAGVTCPGGTVAVVLAPGQSLTCRASHVASIADIAAGQIRATVDATATSPDGSQVAAPAASASMPLLTLDIAVRMTLVSGSSEPKEGAVLTFRVEAENRGPIDASGVVLAVRLPAGLDLVSASGDGALDRETGLWAVGALAAGATASLDVEARVANGSAEENLASSAELVSVDQVDPGDANDRSRVPVTVARTVVVASDDDAGDVTALIEAAQGAAVATTANVLSNDTIDGVAADPARATVRAVPDGGNPLIIAADGSVRVRTGVAAGTYRLTYRICLVSNPANCAEAAVSAVVSPVPLTAADDVVRRHANGRDGEAGLVNVFANDRRGERAVAPSNVRATTLESAPPNSLELKGDGTIDLAPGSPAGTSTLTYEICEILNPENCSRAAVTVPVALPAIVSGAVYRDDNGNGTFDAASDPAFANYAVELSRDSAVVATAKTGPSGQYAFPKVWPGPGYALVFRDPGGALAGGVAGLDVPGGTVMTGEDLATDPTGIVYDARSREPVAGAVVTVADAEGRMLPSACFFVPGQQEQTTGADGAYRIDLAPGADQACPAAQTEYAISVRPPDGYRAPSAAYPPLAGPLDITACVFDAVPGGACQPSASVAPPPPGRASVHVLSVLLQAGDPPLMHNHIPIDPLVALAPPEVTATADRSTLKNGEAVELAIAIRNGDPSPVRDLRVTNIMPPGFSFVAGSAAIDGKPVEPAVSSSAVAFGPLTLPGNSGIRIGLQLQATQGAGVGRHVNRVRLAGGAGGPPGQDALTEIEVVAEPAADCMEVAGTVFADTNRDGIHDASEAGLGGAVIVTDTGTPVVTDRLGRYQLPCSQLPNTGAGPELVVTLDTKSLPAGYVPTTENPRTLARAAGAASGVDFGAAKPREVRLDLQDAAFAGATTDLKPEWAAGIERLVDVLAEQPSALRIVYKTGVDGALARQRIETVEQAVRARWRQLGHAGDLAITSRIAGE